MSSPREWMLIERRIWAVTTLIILKLKEEEPPREIESTTRNAGGKSRECVFGKPRELRAPRKRIHQRHQMLCSEHWEWPLDLSSRLWVTLTRIISVDWQKQKSECSVAQPGLTLCSPMDCSLPDSSVLEIFQQEYWSQLSLPSPGDHPDPAIKPTSPVSPAWTGRFFTNSTSWEASQTWMEWS